MFLYIILQSCTIELHEEKTIQFVNAFIKSDLPEVVKEAALFNMSTLGDDNYVLHR